jgi:membrane protein DedA with SNARE-associated domain
LFQWIVNTVSQSGYGGIILLMFLENIFPPIPSELIMPLAGFAAARGDLNMAGVIAAGTIGSLLGALPGIMPADGSEVSGSSAWRPAMGAG